MRPSGWGSNPTGQASYRKRKEADLSLLSVHINTEKATWVQEKEAINSSRGVSQEPQQADVPRPE